MIDSHAHIYLEQFDKDRDEVIRRAEDTGITHILMPNVDEKTVDSMLEADLRYRSCLPMIGLHPCSVDKKMDRQLYVVEEWLSKRDFIAIGEIGTDLYWDRSYWSEQQEAFKIQVGWAAERNLPVVIHCRDSIEDTIEIIANMGLPSYKGVFHCFTGTLDQAKRITEMGFHLGIGGVATFRNGNLDEVIMEIPLSYLLLETDSPYLAPVPNRGKRNEPSFLRFVAEKIAEVRGISVEEVSETTTANCVSLFGIA
jgi:TatD DNase family protein